MGSTFCFLLPILALAVALDIFFVKSLHRFRKLKTEATDQDGILRVSNRDLWMHAFFKTDNAITKNTDGQIVTAPLFTQRRLRPSRLTMFALEWLFIILLAYFYSGSTLLNFDATKLQQTGEHNESATLPLLAEIGLWRYGEIPLWNPYMLAGFPHVGDFVNHFWNPVSTIPILLWGGINGMKVSIFLSFIIAGLGQWMFAHVIGLRPVFRLWSAVLFMLSGGLALLWRVGWYELLVGAAWFPWCFAFYWRALQQHSLKFIFLTAIAIFLVISTGGGYYPVYLLVSLVVLTCVALIRVSSGERLNRIRTAASIAVVSAALSAVVILPYLHGFRYTVRDAAPDTFQHFSQPIHYGLINYIVHTPDWFRANILGTASGWNWFYIGWLPIAALAFIPLAVSRSTRLRWRMLTSGLLFLVLIMWFANQFSPFKQVYEWIPFLYTFRFPNRLLIIATSPLLILSAQALEYAYRLSRAGVRNFKLVHTPSGKKPSNFAVHYLVAALWIVGLATTTRGVYEVNQQFAFIDQVLNPKPFAVLQWLKNYDPSTYYVNIGGGVIYWDWTPAAYTLEMPVLNFQYNRHLRSQDLQRRPSSPFFARAKYQISLPDQPFPGNAQQLREFEGVLVWYIPDTLPYAFSVLPALIQEYSPLTVDQVTPLSVRINGPNQIIVRGAPQQEGEVLVALASDYPGWKLLIDGKPAEITPFNGYLGSRMLPGEHLYTFYFLPAQFIVGAAISALTLIAMILIPFAGPVRAAMQRVLERRWQSG